MVIKGKFRCQVNTLRIVCYVPGYKKRKAADEKRAEIFVSRVVKGESLRPRDGERMRENRATSALISDGWNKIRVLDHFSFR